MFSEQSRYPSPDSMDVVETVVADVEVVVAVELVEPELQINSIVD